MSDIEIIDNFLDQKEFDELQTLMMSHTFAWFYTDGITFGVLDSDKKLTFPNEVDRDKFQFSHMIYINFAPSSPLCEKLGPTIKKIAPISIRRIKANLLTKTSDIVENEFHIDIGGISEEKLKQLTTSIFYLNTNNGYTEFESGEIVESVENRMVIFDGDERHRGVSCTDEKVRIVINFNYFP